MSVSGEENRAKIEAKLAELEKLWPCESRPTFGARTKIEYPGDHRARIEEILGDLVVLVGPMLNHYRKINEPLAAKQLKPDRKEDLEAEYKVAAVRAILNYRENYEGSKSGFSTLLYTYWKNAARSFCGAVGAKKHNFTRYVDAEVLREAAPYQDPTPLFEEDGVVAHMRAVVNAYREKLERRSNRKSRLAVLDYLVTPEEVQKSHVELAEQIGVTRVRIGQIIAETRAELVALALERRHHLDPGDREALERFGGWYINDGKVRKPGPEGEHFVSRIRESLKSKDIAAQPRH